jgi:hypothetical protein
VSFRVRALVVALGALVLAGCHAEGRVDVVVHDDGSGTVTVAVGLDAQAAQRVGDLATAVPTVDLVDAGWKVGHPRRSGGLTWLEATKPFRSPTQLGAVLGEVGMFRDWTVHVSDGFGSTTWKVTGRIVVSGGLDQFSDSDLAAALDGMPLGMTPEELSAALADSGPLPVTVRVRMPGATDDLTSIPVQLDASTSIDRPVQVESARSTPAPTRWLVVAGILAALAAATYVVNRLRLDRSRAGRRPPARSRPGV